MKKIILLVVFLLSVISLFGCVQSTTSTLTEVTTPTTLDTAWVFAEDDTDLSYSDRVNAYDNPFHIGLFLTENPTTSMAINFELPKETKAFVQYRQVNSEQSIDIEASYKVTKVGKKTVHLYEAIMDNLTPNTTYEYRVHDELWENYSPGYQFKTPSTDADSFSFMVLADPQENSALGYMAFSHILLNAMNQSSNPIDFNLFVGDMVNDADSKLEWDEFFNYASPFIYNIPMIATTGNHDMAGISGDRMTNIEFDGYFNLPNNGPLYNEFDNIENDDRPTTVDHGKTYSFNYHNTHFIALNSETLCDGTTACSLSDQANIELLKTWLIEDLSSNTQLWTIVFLHRSPYSLSYNNIKIREELTPIFDEYEVDLVLAGHDHQYSRSIYQSNTLVPFQTSDDYAHGTLNLYSDEIGNLDFNDYDSSMGVTYLVGNTSGTKFYGNIKSSGIAVHYAFLDCHPVVPIITVTDDYIQVVSYAFSKTSEFQIEVDSIYILETFYIR